LKNADRCEGRNIHGQRCRLPKGHLVAGHVAFGQSWLDPTPEQLEISRLANDAILKAQSEQWIKEVSDAEGAKETTPAIEEPRGYTGPGPDEPRGCTGPGPDQ
jgi:hypothetical protein